MCHTRYLPRSSIQQPDSLYQKLKHTHYRWYLVSRIQRAAHGLVAIRHLPAIFLESRPTRDFGAYSSAVINVASLKSSPCSEISSSPILSFSVSLLLGAYCIKRQLGPSAVTRMK